MAKTLGLMLHCFKYIAMKFVALELLSNSSYPIPCSPSWNVKSPPRYIVTA